ncbi:MAG: ABC transporter permease [Chloroflexota bacterium]|nr:ABC transporter permease [Chloroflexota bacterium]
MFTWEITVQVGWLDNRFFPPPTVVLQTLFELMFNGELFDHLSASLQRISLGFVLGAVPGIGLGMLMGWFRIVRAFFDPIISALYPIPKIALLPLLLIIFGLGETTRVVIVAMPVFFLSLITTMQGVKGLDPILLQAGQNFGATGWKLFIKIILPATLPAIFTGLRLSLGVALIVIVAAEFVAADTGIGYLIWSSWSVFLVDQMYAGLVVIAFLGLLFTNGLEYIGRRLMPWAQEI